MNIFFNFVSVNFYLVTIIELCKLFNHNKTCSLKKLLNKFNSKQEFNRLVDEIKLREYLSDLNRNKDLINELIETKKIQTLLHDAKMFCNGEVYQKSYNFDFPLGTPLDSLNLIMNRIEFHDNFLKNLIKHYRRI